MVNKKEEKLLRTLGLRATPQRLAIISALTRTKRPSSVEDVVRMSRIAIDTVTAYRTLDTFIKIGVVRKVRIADDRALYELANDHHHHAVCTSCGTIRDVATCLPKGLDAKVKKTSGFSSIQSHTLDFFGLCKSCANAK
jgi:Fe2+ or Zn2+ uptake regulation protein